MRARLQDPVQVRHMKKGCGRIIKTRWGTVRRGKIEIPKATILKSMRTGKEPEAQVLEGRDPVERTWHMIGETTAKIGGETPTKMEEETWTEIVEGILGMKLVGETTAQKEGVGETTVQGRGKTEEEKEVGKTTPLIRVGGILDKIGEGVARGPMVMEGPQQANP